MPHPNEIWTWKKCSSKIQSLSGKNGFSCEPVLRFLGYELDTRNGSLFDNLTEKKVDTSKRSGKSIFNTILYILTAYSDAENRKPTGQLISAKQFRGTKFTNRDAIGERLRLIREFMEKNEHIVLAVKKLGGYQIAFPYGDVAVRLDALPLIPIVIVLSTGDKELPSDARIFYDDSIENYFDSEQTYFLTHLTVTRLVQSKTSFLS
jgi:hypothetical protein